MLINTVNVTFYQYKDIIVSVPQCIWCPCDACVSAGLNLGAPRSQTAQVLLRSSCPERLNTAQHLLYTHRIIHEVNIGLCIQIAL